MNIKESLASGLDFIKRNLILVTVILGLSYWFFPEIDHPIVLESRNSMKGYSTSMDMAMMDVEESYAPQVSKRSIGRSGGIMPPVYAEGFDPDQAEKKIVKNGSLSIEVHDPEKAKNEAEVKVGGLGGSITNLNSWEVRPGVLSYNMTLRVPAESLDKAIDILAGLGTKKSENYSVQDITASYFDTENQLANLRTRRDRLRTLMEKETKELKDILEVDRELSNVQNQIENLERIQKGRDVDVSYSALNLSIQPEPEIGDVNNPHWSVGRSWKTSVNDLINASQGIFDKAIKLLIFTPIWLPILLVLVWVKRRFISH